MYATIKRVEIVPGHFEDLNPVNLHLHGSITDRIIQVRRLTDQTCRGSYLYRRRYGVNGKVAGRRESPLNSTAIYPGHSPVNLAVRQGLTDSLTRRGNARIIRNQWREGKGVCHLQAIFSDVGNPVPRQSWRRILCDVR